MLDNWPKLVFHTVHGGLGSSTHSNYQQKQNPALGGIRRFISLDDLFLANMTASGGTFLVLVYLFVGYSNLTHQLCLSESVHFTDAVLGRVCAACIVCLLAVENFTCSLQLSMRNQSLQVFKMPELSNHHCQVQKTFDVDNVWLHEAQNTTGTWKLKLLKILQEGDHVWKHEEQEQQ
ncbi:hypothetical protein OPV22_022900 [Ensete ventricosum]|uniref:Uncharacterized protein n=1 Tax=Ensete ventricosum TaxID=4639 RepID=A0AAV8QVK0_ENSVE|nr:hypothetical protein OPV22_022900 [Ensete ventricosum]